MPDYVILPAVGLEINFVVTQLDLACVDTTQYACFTFEIFVCFDVNNDSCT